MAAIDVIESIAGTCNNCGRCVQECGFLQTYGTPGQISATFLADGCGAGLHASYSCTLCGLCEAVCPLDLPCSRSFLQMRRVAAAKDTTVHANHRTIHRYVKIGSSPAFVLASIPTNCDTVFFPGCALSGTRSGTVLRVYDHLRKHLPDLGIVLDCCAKPLRDLGRQAEFAADFDRLVGSLKAKGVKKIITACPSCHVTFREYAPELEGETVYQVLVDRLPAVRLAPGSRFAVHDTCTTRFDDTVQESVRALVRSCGGELFEMAHSRRKTLCCGEGGAALFVAPELAGSWKALRQQEGHGATLITYCAGCATTFGRAVANVHLLDLLFFPDEAVRGRLRVTKSPFTYLRRLLLKRRLLARQKDDAK